MCGIVGFPNLPLSSRQTKENEKHAKYSTPGPPLTFHFLRHGLSLVVKMTPPNPRPRGLSLVPAHLMSAAGCGWSHRATTWPVEGWLEIALHYIAVHTRCTPHYVWVGCVVISRNSTTLLAPRLSVVEPLFGGSNRFPLLLLPPGRAGRLVGS